MNCELFMEFYCFLIKLIFYKIIVKILKIHRKKYCILCGMIIVLHSQKIYILQDAFNV